MRFGDEVGMLWDEPPVIKPPKGTKKSNFNANVGVKENYKPPTGFMSFIGRPRIALDIETKDPDLLDKGPSMYRGGGKIAGVALATSYTEGEYYPTGHANTDRCVANPEAFYNQLRYEAANFEGEIVTANGMYDLDWLQEDQGIYFPKARLRDVQIKEGLLDENRFTYRLDVLGNEYLGEGKATDVLSGLYGKGYIENMDRVDPGHAAEYATRDACMVLEIDDIQQPQIESQGLQELYDLESDLAPLLLRMRQVGVRVNIDGAEEALEMITKVTTEGREELRQLAGMPVDVFAGATIARACDHLSIKYPMTKPSKNYPSGQPSFVKAWMESHTSDFIKKVCEQRGFEKIGGTFVKSYILDGHVDGRLHCQFHQLKGSDNGARTGRFSSSGPNLQNIPTRHKILGPLLRGLFIPEEGMLWGGADWSQIEYRLLVHYASITPGIDVEKALRMYLDDPRTDFHALAAEIAGTSRKVAKNINFGVVYGMGILKMAESLGLSYNEGKAILQEFHTRSPFMKEMLNTASARASAKGYIKTMLGRRRRFPQWEYNGKIYSSEEVARSMAEQYPARGQFPRVAMTHKALNALLQGSAADLMKIAMVKMWKSGIFEILIPHLTVHDEMNVSVPQTKAGREAFSEMCNIMTTCVKLAVPILVDSQCGANWAETK